MSDIQPEAAPRSGMQLWYCNACTRLINPPGSEGVLGPDGNRYCTKCAPARKGSAVVEAVKQGSRAVIPAVAKTHAEPHNARSAHAAHGQTNVPPKKSAPLVAFGLGGAAICVVAAVLYALSGSPKPESVATNTDPAPKPVAQNITPEARPAAPASTDKNQSGKPPLPSGGLFGSLSRGGDAPARDPAQPATPPQPQAPAQPAPQPAQAAPAPEPAKPVLSQDEFRAALAGARDLANASNFGQAFAALKSARDRFGAAGWFDVEQKGLSDLEARVQQQLADFTSEVEDLRNRVQKSDSLDVLLSTEREWKERLRGASGGEVPLWILMEPLKAESSGGATLTLQPDGAVLASGNNPDRDVITLTARIWRREITALRLEALPHPSLPAKGPGRAPNGNIALSKIRVLAREEFAPDGPRELPLSNPSFDIGQGAIQPSHVLDEDPHSHWAFDHHQGRAHVLIVKPGPLPGGSGPWLVSVVLEFQTPFAQHAIGHLRCSVTTQAPPPAATEARAFDAAKPFSVDPLVQKPVGMLLKAVDERRSAILRAAEERKQAELTQQLDTLERQVKSRPARIEGLLKGLDTLETMLPETQEAALPLLERLAQARFDLLSAKDGELSLFEANVRAMGGGAELVYDFSTENQYGGWTADIPNGGGGIAYDPKASNVRLSVFNKRNWDNEDRRNAPIFRQPFLFDPNNWVFEAALTLAEDKRAQSKPHLGILVWDGKYSARFFLRENSAKDIALQMTHCHPNQNATSRPTMMPGSIRDTYWLNMTCINGQVAFSARNAAGKVAVLSVGREKLNFEPKFFGVFMRSDDDGEIAVGTIDNVRFTGQPLRDKVKDAHQARRLSFVQRYKEDWLRARAAPPYLAAEREGRLGAEWHRLWTQSGGASAGRHHDRDNVWISHPSCVGRPFVWKRKVTLEAGKNGILRFDTRGARDYQLAVRVNDQELLSKTIADQGWQTIEVPLTRFAGQTVQIEIQNHCGGQMHWQEEFAYWDKIRIESQ